MKACRLKVAALVLALSTVSFSQFSLTTTFAGGNGQNGVMFDIVALSTVLITSFDCSIAAGTTQTIEIWTHSGTWVGTENSSVGWTQLGVVPGVVSAGTNLPTPIPLPLSQLISGGQTQAFYITNTSGTMAYTNGTAVGAVYAQDTFIQFLQGCGKVYPFGGTFTPRVFNGVIHYQPGTGLFANFSATGASGPAPRTVNFTDLSYSSDPAGVQSWAWDFENDGIIDSFQQNPSFVYVTPGTYTVALTVTDASFPASTIVKTNFVTVGQYVFDVQTTGSGVGDLVINGIPSIGAPTAAQGFTLLSFVHANPVGIGPFFGLIPDPTTISILQAPPAVGNPLHYFNAPGLYPEVPLTAPAGALSFLAGVTVDFVQVGLTAGYNLVFVSNADSVTF